MDITKTKITSGDKQYLRFAETVWNEDGEVESTKIGFVQVKPEKADELLAKYLSGEKKRTFGTKDSLGNYEMILVGANTAASSVADNELAHSAEEPA